MQNHMIKVREEEHRGFTIEIYQTSKYDAEYTWIARKEGVTLKTERTWHYASEAAMYALSAVSERAQLEIEEDIEELKEEFAAKAIELANACLTDKRLGATAKRLLHINSEISVKEQIL